jgi:glycosyltransferase involved in cell wall biosynthesis
MITVILTKYKRPHLLENQFISLRNQTLKPDEILVCDNSLHNLGVWARFSMALNAKSDFVCVIDLSNDKRFYDSDYIKKYGRRFSDNNGKLFNISDSKGGSPVGRKKPWSLERKENHKLNCKEKRKYDPTYEELYHDYIIKNLRRKDISQKYNISEVLVKKRLGQYGIIKPKNLAYPTRNEYFCFKCNKKFETPFSVKNRKYCSRSCYRSVTDDIMEK